MKYLVLIIVVLLVLYLVKAANRRQDGGDAQSKDKKAATGPPQDMVQCPVCLVHLPRGDALPGPNGQLYCCAEHRVRAGG